MKILRGLFYQVASWRLLELAIPSLVESSSVYGTLFRLLIGKIILLLNLMAKCTKLCTNVKNPSSQVRPVCSPKDEIWSRTDKLQRCRRLPLGQAKLRQILENKSEGVLIRKWFDRWYVAESLCDRLRSKINHVLISQQHESRRGRPIFPVRISTISTRMDLSFARPLHV